MSLYLGLTDWARVDLVVEKAAELGVREVALIASERAGRLPAPDAWARRRERLLRVAVAAARQSGQAWLPRLRGLVPFGDALGEIPTGEGCLIDPRGDAAIRRRSPAVPAGRPCWSAPRRASPTPRWSGRATPASRSAGSARRSCAPRPRPWRRSPWRSTPAGAPGRWGRVSAATTFSVRFLGCKVSQADAALIRDALRDAGHVETAPEAAEVHVVNTCALTVEAERKSRREANRGARARARLRLGLRGEPQRGPVRRPGGHDPARLGRPRGAPRSSSCWAAAATTACADDAPRAPGRTRAFLKVQNGCDSECAFCIIPTTRGRAESRPLARILADARRRIDEGHPELVLTGINIGTFRDPGSGADLADLVRARGAPGGAPAGCGSPRSSRATSPTACSTPWPRPRPSRPTCTCPLQSGDPGVLRAMRRSYGVGEYLDACRRAAAAAARPQPDHRRDRRLPGRGRGRLRRHRAGGRGAGDEQGPRLPVLPAPGHRRRGDGGAPGRRSELRERAGRLRDLSDRLGFAHRTPSRRRPGRGAGGAPPRRRDARRGWAPTTRRFVLPAGAGAPGEMVAVAVAGRRRRAPGGAAP